MEKEHQVKYLKGLSMLELCHIGVLCKEEIKKNV